MSKIILDGKPHPAHALPDGPLFIVWGPCGDTPVRHVFTKIEWARKAAKNMAKRKNHLGSVFYVCTLISWHQQQVDSVMGHMRTQIL